ncbi:MAG: sodium:solute symporter family protein [Flavobacteriales bacterium]
MPLPWIDLIIVIAFLALTLGIGYALKGKAEGGLRNFFLGGRNLPWYVAGMSMVATTFAADTPLAVSEMVADGGIAKNWLWWSFLSGGLLTTFFFADLWRRADILTELEFLRIRYSGKGASFLRGFKAVYLGVFMNIMILGWVNLAFQTFLELFFDLSPLAITMITAAAMLFAAFYSSIAGLLGIAVTDAVQFVIAMIGTIILAILVVNSPEVGGIEGLREKLPKERFDFFPKIGENSTGGVAGTLKLTLGVFLAYIGVQWWASWYPGFEPGGGGYMAQRMMATRSEKDAVQASLFFQLAHFCIRPWPWILIGLSAIVLYGTPGEGSKGKYEERIQALKKKGVAFEQLPKKLPALKGAMQDPERRAELRYAYSKRSGYVMAMRDHLPTGLRGLLLVAFIAAYLSTVSTQLNWGASYLVNDLYLPYMSGDDPPDRIKVRSGRIATLFLMVLSLISTSFMTSISGVWEFVLECGAGIGGVLILRWYWWRINAWSEFSATLAPFIGYAIGHFWLAPAIGAAFTDHKGPFFFTVLFSTIVWVVVTFATPPTDRDQLQAFFQRVKPGLGWSPFRIKGEKRTQHPGWLFLCWGSALLMTYSILFFIGRALLRFAEKAFFWGGMAILSYLLFRYALRKSGILKQGKNGA